MAQRTSPQPAKMAAAKAFNAFNLVSFTIGTKASNTINVAMVFKDARGQTIAQVVKTEVYLSDNADGSTLTATATTSAIAVATNGVVSLVTTTGKAADVLTTATGLLDLNIIQTASPVTYYLCVKLPDGGLAISGAITF